MTAKTITLGLLFFSLLAFGCAKSREKENDEKTAQGDAGARDLDAEVPPQRLSRQELLACLNGITVLKQEVDKVESVDLLFVVDNWRSMEPEQAKLREQFPRMIKALMRGDKTPDNNVEDRDFIPVKELHLAIMSSDLGLPGLGPEDNPVTTGECIGTGDDGNFLHDPTHAIAAGSICPEVNGAALPVFLEHTRKDRESLAVTLESAEAIAAEFNCYATMSLDGCSFRMPLEAALKALWPSQIDNLTEAHRSADIRFLAGSQGRGDREHRSFLRGTPYHPSQPDTLSLLAIVVVTEEPDCSAGALGNLGFLSLNYPLRDRQDICTRCYLDTVRNWGNKYPVERYINGLKALRPDHPELVLFSAIAGIPTTIEEDADRSGEITSEERQAFFERLSSQQVMQGIPSTEHCGLTYACTHDGDMDGLEETRAEPASRLTEVASGFGPNGVVRPICAATFTSAMNAIIDAISNNLGAVCLENSYTRASDGRIPCDVIWRMPPGRNCEQYTYLSDAPAHLAQQGSDGRQRCVVDQLAVFDPNPDYPPDALDLNYRSGLGWYYDDFSSDMKAECRMTDRVRSKQRIAFFIDHDSSEADQAPPADVSVELVCYPERSNPLSSTEQAGLSQNWSCAWERCSEGDFYCYGSTDVCVVSCQTDADCEDNDLQGWVCSSMGIDGHESICVSPTCGE